jgi:hypothetical protein
MIHYLSPWWGRRQNSRKNKYWTRPPDVSVRISVFVNHGTGTTIRRHIGASNKYYSSAEAVLTNHVNMHMIKLLADYFASAAISADSAALFRYLTQAKHLPYAHFSSAVRLMDVERRCSPAGLAKKTPKLTCLQRRCITSISENVCSLDKTDKEHLSLLSFNKTIKPALLTELIAASIATMKVLLSQKSVLVLR